jgi:hypothetical protein
MVILGWQAYAWLTFGLWPALPLRAATNASGLGVPKVKWVGVQQIIEYIYGCPLSFVVFLTFVTLAVLVILEDARHEPPTDQQATPDLP